MQPLRSNFENPGGGIFIVEGFIGDVLLFGARCVVIRDLALSGLISSI